MKNSLKVVLCVITIMLVISLIFFVFIRIPNKDTPDRLSNIPKTAIWKGGIDEGFWFELVSVNTTKKTYRMRIYNDYKGELVLDADFIKQGSCKSEYPLNEDVFKDVSYFEFDKIEMINNCNLKMIKPAYGGIFWEMDKENE